MTISLAAKSVCFLSGTAYVAQVIPGIPEAGQLGTMGALICAVAWLVRALGEARKRADEKETQFLARLDAKDKQLDAKGDQLIAMTREVTNISALAMEAVKESRANGTQVLAAIEEFRGELLRDGLS